MKKILYNRQKSYPPVPHMKMQDLRGISYKKGRKMWQLFRMRNENSRL